MKKYLALTVTLLILLGGCHQKLDLEKKKKELMEIDREFSRMSVEKGMLEAFYQYMAEDATTFPRFGHPIKGRETYQKTYKKELAGQKIRLEWEPYFAEIAESGDLGYTLGKYKVVSIDEEGAEQLRFGYYVTIWKMQEDGSWKFVFDTGNESPPPGKQ